jgi:hypothetical protein
VFTIGLGIGTTVTMVSVYETIIQHTLPVRDQERLVVLWTHRGDPHLEVSGSFQQLTQQFAPDARTLASVAGVAHWGAAPTPFIDGDDAIVLNRALVTGNYFDVLGATPAAGRLLRADDPSTGTALSMVISYGTWRRRFGGNAMVIGRTLRDAYSQRIYTIVGVAPPGLDYPTGVEAWTLPWSPQLAAFALRDSRPAQMRPRRVTNTPRSRSASSPTGSSSAPRPLSSVMQCSATRAPCLASSRPPSRCSF